MPLLHLVTNLKKNSTLEGNTSSTKEQLQYEVATFSSTHEKKDYSNMKEQYTNKTGKAQHSGLNSLQASMWKNVRSQVYAWDEP